MSHLDEGTIHAWLDGALPADEASRVEAHARDCAQCAAMVAEARGFIAGATRIVSSLDVVPGNVIPGAPAAPGTSPAARNSVWKRLKLTPARAAIAATILVGVASMFSVRHRDFQSSSARDEIATSVPPAVVERVVVPGAPAAAGGIAAAPAPAASAPAASAQAPARAAADSAGGARREAKRALAAETSRSATADRSLEQPKPAADSSVRRQLAEVTTTGVAPQKAAAANSAASAAAGAAGAAAGASAGAPAPRPTAAQPNAAPGRFTRRIPVEAPAAVAASDLMIKPEGCYAIDQQSDVDLHGFPPRFELAHDSSNGNVVHRVNSAGVPGSVVTGATWQMQAGTSVVISVKSPGATTSLDLQFLLGDSTVRVTDRGRQSSIRLARVDCGR